MSGFLQRLAARALGQPTPIHAATPSPLPFPSAEPAVGWPATPPATQAAVSEATPPRPSIPAPIPASPPPPHAASRQPEPPDMPAARPPVVMGLDSRPEPIPTRRARDAARPRVEPASALPADAAPRAMRQPPTAMAEAEPGAAPGALQETSAVAAGEAGRAPAWASPSGSMPAAPLLPLDAHPALRPRPAQPAAAWPARPSRPGAPVEETTEVRVSIGRIEITAVHEAPPSRTAPKAGKGNPPMSLDEYLARRQGGTP